MGELGFYKRDRRWNTYQRFERELKTRFLRKLSERKSLVILGQLYQYAYNLSGASGFNLLDKDKIKTLARVHSVFGKVKI